MGEALEQLFLKDDPVIGALGLETIGDDVISLRKLQKTYPLEDVLRNQLIEGDSLQAYVTGSIRYTLKKALLGDVSSADLCARSLQKGDLKEAVSHARQIPLSANQV